MATILFAAVLETFLEVDNPTQIIKLLDLQHKIMADAPHMVCPCNYLQLLQQHFQDQSSPQVV